MLYELSLVRWEILNKKKFLGDGCGSTLEGCLTSTKPVLAQKWGRMNTQMGMNWLPEPSGERRKDILTVTL